MTTTQLHLIGGAALGFFLWLHNPRVPNNWLACVYSVGSCAIAAWGLLG